MRDIYYKSATGEIIKLNAYRSFHLLRTGGMLAVAGIPEGLTKTDVETIQLFSSDDPSSAYLFLSWLWQAFKTLSGLQTLSYEEFAEYAKGRHLRLVVCAHCGLEVPVAKTFADSEGNYVCASCREALGGGTNAVH